MITISMMIKEATVYTEISTQLNREKVQSGISIRMFWYDVFEMVT